MVTSSLNFPFLSFLRRGDWLGQVQGDEQLYRLCCPRVKIDFGATTTQGWRHQTRAEPGGGHPEGGERSSGPPYATTRMRGQGEMLCHTSAGLRTTNTSFFVSNHYISIMPLANLIHPTARSRDVFLVWEVEDQQYQKSQGWQNEPNKCKSCRNKSKLCTMFSQTGE